MRDRLNPECHERPKPQRSDETTDIFIINGGKNNPDAGLGVPMV